MLDTRESAISGLVDSFSSLGNEHSPKDLKLYQNSVAQELRRLITNYRCIWDGIRNRPDPLTLFNKVNTRTELLDALKSKSLPTLRSQVISLYNALENPCDHQSKPRKKLKKVMKILSNLETTLEEIKFATACIIPDLDPHEVRHDQDFKTVKQLRCRSLSLKIYVVTAHVCEVFRLSCIIIEASGYAFHTTPQKRTEWLAMRDSCSGAIDKALKLMQKSELTVIQEGWKSDIDKINNSLKQFLEFIHQQDRLTKEQSISVGQEVGDQSLSKGTISAIATLKLTRLFLAKLLKLSTDKENFSMVTNLSSRELNSFARVTTTLSISIEKVVNAICGSVDNEMNDALLIQKSASNILAAPKLLFNMIEYVFVPVVHQVDQPSPKIYYRAWFYQWNSVHHSIALSFGDALGFTFI
ncbi:hypothetical protein MJO28_011238 [Puccinia striiformis f. sp. tritici]|uniref:Uncharacterized protein n=3 Tax=Puccinia striiformis TaxID=27350 RepID=A0A0L0UQM8_9BASI|nr:hypothetical protein Pst134EA_020940 [Puccinia striiformis f. sp. tritici]KAI9612534.1 hypothetical protein H4Q26_007691 [Puccinia striiformis f. sp. tritici PST-130]KNE89275.1 hypothetical protein PSTG_17270 [Puccinia striiformis f. sp. tritici PST-78]POW01173.1 hypothetical protein PSTT_12646 [Puccinia striiformis]KAH9447713.1 hypothetical protein Pst134EB_021715 [Puccinia striiformis f. sp. tritici]KAH9457041.1 hypothetical protein Pst134EA_020940 [Puccinia striiformis f. sp. tritici]